MLKWTEDYEFKYQKERKKCYNSIDVRRIGDNWKLRKTVKTLAIKYSQCLQINLVEQDNVISDDKNERKTFSSFFDAAVKNLDIKGPQVYHINKDSGHIHIVLKKYIDHPSILKVMEYCN